MRFALILGGFGLVLAACSLSPRPVGDRADLDAAAARASVAFEEALELVGFPREAARESINSRLCQPSDNLAYDAAATERYESLAEAEAAFRSLVDSWAKLPDAEHHGDAAIRDEEGVMSTTWLVAGGKSRAGGYKLYADVSRDLVSVSIQVSSGCYDPD